MSTLNRPKTRITDWLSRLSPLAAYLIVAAVVCVAITARLTWREPLLGTPYLIFLLAVLLIAWLGKWGPSLAAIVALSFADLYYFAQPYYTIEPAKLTSRHMLGLVGFAIVSLLATSLAGTRHQALIQLEAAANQSRRYLERLRAIMEAALDSIIVIDHQGKIIDFNSAAEAMFGYKREDAMGKEMAQLLVPPESREAHRRGLMHYLKTGEGPALSKRIEMTSIRADGSLFDAELAVVSVPLESGPIFTGYVRDITARKRLERQKDDFIRMASHELKTPVTSTRLYTQLLKRQLQKAGNATAVISTDQIIVLLDRMAQLINDLLDVSKIETGTLRVNLTSVDLNQVLEQALKLARTSSPERQINLQGACDESIQGDRSRLGQVVINLIANAVKYSHPNTPIDVAITCSATHAQISVTDRGIGIPIDAQAHIFERYYRVLDPNEPTASGIGLGLYITAEIVNLHHGRIWVDSTPGQGSTFYVELPLADTHSNRETV